MARYEVREGNQTVRCFVGGFAGLADAQSFAAQLQDASDLTVRVVDLHTGRELSFRR